MTALQNPEGLKDDHHLVLVGNRLEEEWAFKGSS